MAKCGIDPVMIPLHATSLCQSETKFALRCTSVRMLFSLEIVPRRVQSVCAIEAETNSYSVPWRLIGFSTYSGTATAARDWGDPAERRRVRPGMRDSYEELFHATGITRFWLNLRERNDATKLLRQPRLQRAIGVIYPPETDPWTHSFHPRFPHQSDTTLHPDKT